MAHRRLTVIELAERLGNVAEACRRGGIERNQGRRPWETVERFVRQSSARQGG